MVKAIAKKSVSVSEQLAEQIAQSELAKASQLQHIDKLVDVLVEQAPRPIVEKTVEAPQLQYIDVMVNVPVMQQKQVPMVQTVLKTVEGPRLQFIDTVGDTAENRDFAGAVH